MISSQNNEIKSHWANPQPEKIPRPTYFPFLFALGCVFTLFGLVTLWLMSVVGIVIFIIAIIGWIGEMRYEQRSESKR